MVNIGGIDIINKGNEQIQCQQCKLNDQQYIPQKMKALVISEFSFVFKICQFVVQKGSCHAAVKEKGTEISRTNGKERECTSSSDESCSDCIHKHAAHIENQEMKKKQIQSGFRTAEIYHAEDNDEKQTAAHNLNR